MIAIIAAIADNGVIGNKGGLPWHLPADLKHFKQLTLGHVMVMGRKTYESILARLGRPLPDRLSVVLTRQPDFQVSEGVVVTRDLQVALVGQATRDVFIIGGAEVYAEAWPLADTLYLTRVAGSPVGDVFFPPVDYADWQQESVETHVGFAFMVYRRKSRGHV